MYFKSTAFPESQSCKTIPRNPDYETRLKQYKEYADSTSQLNDALNAQVKACYQRIDNLSAELAEARSEFRNQSMHFECLEKKLNEVLAENKSLKSELAKNGELRLYQSKTSATTVSSSLNSRSPSMVSLLQQRQSRVSGSVFLAVECADQLSPNSQLMQLKVKLGQECEHRLGLEKKLRQKQEILESVIFELENLRVREQKRSRKDKVMIRRLHAQLQKYSSQVNIFSSCSLSSVLQEELTSRSTFRTFEEETVYGRVRQLEEELVSLRAEMQKQKKAAIEVQRMNRILQQHVSGLQRDLENSVTDLKNYTIIKDELLTLRLEVSRIKQQNDNLRDDCVRLDKKRTQQLAQLETLKTYKTQVDSQNSHMRNIYDELKKKSDELVCKVGNLQEIKTSNEQQISMLHKKLEGALKRERLFSASGPRKDRQKSDVRRNTIKSREDDAPVREKSCNSAVTVCKSPQGKP